MADIVFTTALGRLGYLAGLPGAADGLVLVPIEAAGLVPDATLRDYADLAALLAGPCNEQTVMGRKLLAGVTAAVDHAADRVDVGAASVTWAAAAGSPISAVVVGYVPDVTTVDDAAVILLTKHDVVFSPNGVNDFTLSSPGGLARVTSLA